MKRENDLGAMVANKIAYLKSINDDDSEVRAVLARLRRCIGKKPGADPYVWNETLADLPSCYLPKSSSPTPAEWAVHIALSLFSLHQQGRDINTDCVHCAKKSLGTAVREYVMFNEDRIESVIRRFNTILTSDSIEEFAHHLRGMIQLFKTEHRICLDYAQLTWDLFKFQNPDKRDELRLSWGRDYCYDKNPDSSKQ